MIDWEMDWWRARGRAEERGEEGGIEWIRVLRVGFEDFRDSFEADERNSSAEELRDERSLFSIFDLMRETAKG